MAAGRGAGGEIVDTAVDRMLAFLRKKKSATVGEVATALALDTPLVEKLAEVLRESGLVTIRYSMMDSRKNVLFPSAGGTVSRSTAIRAREGERYAAGIPGEEIALEMELPPAAAPFKTALGKLEEAERVVVDAEERVFTRIEETKGIVSKIRSEGEAESDPAKYRQAMSFIAEELDLLERASVRLEEKAAELAKRAKDLHKEITLARAAAVKGRPGTFSFVRKLFPKF